jgi:hypothetical protein
MNKITTAFERVRRIGAGGGAYPSGLRFLIEYVIPFIVIIALFFVLFEPALRATFRLHEDPAAVIGTTDLLNSNHGALLPTVWDLVKGDLPFGRFRPIYFLYVVAGATAFGFNITGWHIVGLVVGIFTCMFFYRAARDGGMPIIGAAFFGLWLIVTGLSSTALWVRFVPAETPAMLILAVACWATIKACQRLPQANRWDALVLLLLACAGLTKENFVLVIPAVILFRLIYNWRRYAISWPDNFKGLRYVIATAGLIIAVQLTIDVLLLRVGGYSAVVVGGSAATLNPLDWITRFAKTYDLGWLYFLPLLIGLIVADGLGRGNDGRQIALMTFLLAVIWLAPQFALYQGRLIDRYLYPAWVAVALSGAVAVSIIWASRRVVTIIAAFAVILAGLVSPLAGTTSSASHIHAESFALDRLLRCTVQQSQSGQAVIIVVDPASNYEPLYSVEILLPLKGLTSRSYEYPVYRHPGESGAYTGAVGPQSLDPVADKASVEALHSNQVAAIILLDSKALFEATKPSWFIASDWQVQHFSEPVYALWLLDGFAQVDSVRMNMLIPRPDGSQSTNYKPVCATADPAP